MYGLFLPSLFQIFIVHKEKEGCNFEKIEFDSETRWV